MKTSAVAALHLASLLLLAGANGAAAQDFPAGKNLDFIVGGTAGGGYDQYARAIARHIGKHLPHKPNVVVRNLPGAGGLVATNYLFNAAPRDGSTIAALGREMALGPLLTPNAGSYQYKAMDFAWIGSPQQDTGLLLINAKAPAQTLEAMRTQPLQMSGLGPGTLPSVFPVLINNVLGTKFNVVNGYPGSPEALMAVERGEVDGHTAAGTSAALRAKIDPLIAKGEMKAVLQLGLSKDPAYDAPLLLDLVKDEGDRKLVEVFLTPQYAGRPIAAPPSLAPGLVAALRNAFEATMRDPEFRAEAASQKLELNPVTGVEIEVALARVYAMPADLIRRASVLAQ